MAPFTVSHYWIGSKRSRITIWGKPRERVKTHSSLENPLQVFYLEHPIPDQITVHTDAFRGDLACLVDPVARTKSLSHVQ